MPGDGIRKPRLLLTGERKGLTDRVIIVPGPNNETATIREILSLFVEKRLNIRQIAVELNTRCVRSTTGNLWNKHHIHRIIHSLLYIGTQVYGRKKLYLSGPTIRQPTSSWTMKTNCLKPIVSSSIFEAAQRRVGSYTKNKSQEQILNELRALWKRKGRLSREIIEGSSSVVSVSTLEKRFGGLLPALLPAYKLIGFNPRTRCYDCELLAKLRFARSRFIATLCAELPQQFEIVERGGNWAPRLRYSPLNLDLSVLIARHHRTVTGKIRWAARPILVEGALILD